MPERQFKLPQRCDCGARGLVTFQEGNFRRSGETHPRLEVVAVEGSFGLNDKGEVVCMECGT